VLRPLRSVFNPADFPSLLVGLNDPDDAAIWKLDDDRALVVTTDFFTPVVDNPYDYGAIAAANALSDVYAMGGTPFLALNIAALPPDLPHELSGEILRGGAEKSREAGVVLAGGHTIQDEEPKYGLIVLGFVHPNHVITKSGACPGQKLILSKPIGFGVVTTALKRGLAAPEDVIEASEWMKRLNSNASKLAVKFGIRGGTDITGFSLLGHGVEMTIASKVNFLLHFDKIPLTRGARNYADQWIFPGGSSDNRLYYGEHVHFDKSIDEASQMLLFDAQTSGGLLLSVPEDLLPSFLQEANRNGTAFWEIGEVREGTGIEVIR